MRFTPLSLSGAHLVEMERRADDRGWFARTWCRREFAEHGLDSRLVQCNVSWNERRGTLRGLHFQAAPHGEAKLVRCVRGALCDVIVDLRPSSPTYCDWLSIELAEDDGRLLYVPDGFAHGFQTLRDGTELFYQMSEFHVPEASRGVRWDDPAFGIDWPLPDPVLSDRDRSYPDFAK